MRPFLLVIALIGLVVIGLSGCVSFYPGSYDGPVFHACYPIRHSIGIAFRKDGDFWFVK
jgi:hypothetical protein